MKWFWLWFHKKYGKENIGMLHIPMTILGRFDWHYFLYDEAGNVEDGAKNIFEAIRKNRETGMYISRVWG